MLKFEGQVFFRLLLQHIDYAISTTQKFTVGLNFTEERDASKFYDAVETKLHEREKKASEYVLLALLLSIGLMYVQLSREARKITMLSLLDDLQSIL